LEDRRISAKSIAEQLGISRERVGSITHEDLDMLVACFLPARAKDLSAPMYYLLEWVRLRPLFHKRLVVNIRVLSVFNSFNFQLFYYTFMRLKNF
jgi:hypothetical protein